MISELELIDLWRFKNPEGKHSCCSSKVYHSCSRTDFFGVSQQFMYKLTDSHIEPITLSDHPQVILNIDLGKENLIWQDVSWLTNTDVVEDLKQNLKEYFETDVNRDVTPQVLWGVIRGKIIQIATRLQKIHLEEQIKLEKEYNN